MMLMLEYSLRQRAFLCASAISSRTYKQSGFSLIELLISLLIFSVGILGLASLQITSMRMTQDAQQHYIASLLATAISNQLSVNAALPDISFWQTQVSESLPAGEVLVEGIPQGYRVSVRWNSSEDQSAVQGLRSAQYVVDVAP
jgi:type IV pilus assembly protein PilV